MEDTRESGFWGLVLFLMVVAVGVWLLLSNIDPAAAAV
jgi:hypothetical protein